MKGSDILRNRLAKDEKLFNFGKRFLKKFSKSILSLFIMIALVSEKSLFWEG